MQAELRSSEYTRDQVNSLEFWRSLLAVSPFIIFESAMQERQESLYFKKVERPTTLFVLQAGKGEPRPVCAHHPAQLRAWLVAALTTEAGSPGSAIRLNWTPFHAGREIEVNHTITLPPGEKAWLFRKSKHSLI